MAKVPYIGVNGVARKCKSLYIGVDGVARKVKSGYIGVNGVAKQFFSSGKPLSEFAEGDIVYINENGSPVEFYVAKHDYESELNGDGRTLLVRKSNFGEKCAWNSSGVTTYADSDIDTWLNSTYKELLDNYIKNVIGTTKFYYTIGNNDWTVTSLERSIFLLSVTEFGGYNSYAKTEGSKLPISSVLYKTFEAQWTRSPYANFAGASNKYVFLIYDSSTQYTACTSQRYVRPAFTLPEDTLVTGPSM